MNRYKSLKDQIMQYYRHNVICRIGCEDKENINYNISNCDNKDSAHFAIYIHKQFGIAVIWNLDLRKDVHVNYLSLSYNWGSLLSDEEMIRDIYKDMYHKGSGMVEKVLALKVEVLEDNFKTIRDYLLINPKDEGYSEKIDLTRYDNDCICPKPMRERLSTSRWKRHYKFRDDILNRVDNKCCICRCREKKILQAAHICAVEEGGNDSIDNGICLCANHHLMYDKGIIRIDFSNHTLSYVSESVKNMPWYYTFQKKYNNTLFWPN